VIGLGRFGSTVVGELRDRGDEVLGVDFDPRSPRVADLGRARGLRRRGRPRPPRAAAARPHRWVISTLRDLDTNLHLVSAFQRYGYGGSIAVAADDEDACRQLTSAGADVAIRPLHVAAEPLMRAIHQHGRSGESPRTA
jgi:voltage-gated potassium channel Kch